MKITIEIEIEQTEETEYTSYEKKWWDEHDSTSEYGGV